MRTVVAANIPHGLTREQAAHDSELAMSLGSVVLACEVDRSNDGPFEAAAARYQRRVFFRDRKTQIAFPAKWREVMRMKRTLTDALAGVNPARDMNGLRDLDRCTIYWSMHLPNGKRNRAKRARAWRMVQWLRYEERAARKIAKWNRRGWHQVWGGDINDRQGMDLGLGEEVIAHAGLMWLYALAAPGHRIQHDGEGFAVRKNLGDHPFVVSRNLRFVKES